MSETNSGYGWCQSCGALVFNNSQCHKCDGKVKPFCVDIFLVEQAKKLKDTEELYVTATTALDCQLETTDKLKERIVELEAVCRNALTSLAIINMPVQGNPANVATDKELMDIIAESFKQALKGSRS